MGPSFSRKILRNRDMAGLGTTGNRTRALEDSQFLNPQLAEVLGQQRASQPYRNTQYHRF